MRTFSLYLAGQTVACSSHSLRGYHGQHSFQQIIFVVPIFWGKANLINTTFFKFFLSHFHVRWHIHASFFLWHWQRYLVQKTRQTLFHIFRHARSFQWQPLRTLSVWQYLQYLWHKYQPRMNNLAHSDLVDLRYYNPFMKTQFSSSLLKSTLLVLLMILCPYAHLVAKVVCCVL